VEPRVARVQISTTVPPHENNVIDVDQQKESQLQMQYSMQQSKGMQQQCANGHKQQQREQQQQQGANRQNQQPVPTKAAVAEAISDASSSVAVNGRPTVAAVVATAVRSGKLPVRATHKYVLGRATSNKLSAAKIMKPIRLFVSRLSPDCDSSSVVSFVHDSLLPLRGNFNKEDISCQKLKTKFDSYSSFCVTILVEDSVRQSSLEHLLKAEEWPLDVLVRKFYQQHG
jgi:hypothetical protein